MSTSEGKWTAVTRKTKKKSIKPKLHPKTHGYTYTQTQTSTSTMPTPAEQFNTLRQQIQSIQAKMKSTTFFQDFCTILQKVRQSAEDQPLDIVCYGLGPLTTSANARYQLACVHLFHQMLAKSTSSRVLDLYEPMFTKNDVKLATELGFNVLEKNEEAKRRVERKTLFFMPHCGRQLYQNLLYCNWEVENLANLVIVGNSFESYDNTTISSSVRKNSLVLRLLPYVTEEPVTLLPRKDSESSFYFEAFNDTSIHSFPRVSLNKAQADKIWNLPEDFDVLISQELIRSDSRDNCRRLEVEADNT